MANGTGRVVLISGASSGIGRAVAELLASRGYRVFAGVRAATTFPHPSIDVLPLDVRDETSVKACVAEVYNRVGRIDVLINNAGVNLVGAVEETSIGQAQALFDTNVVGVLRLIQAVLPDRHPSWPSMRAQNTPSKGSRNHSITKCAGSAFA
jgi:NADP-dependent 3-hydroxy acid dehydrogenase YdfG